MSDRKCARCGHAESAHYEGTACCDGDDEWCECEEILRTRGIRGHFVRLRA